MVRRIASRKVVRALPAISSVIEVNENGRRLRLTVFQITKMYRYYYGTMRILRTNMKMTVWRTVSIEWTKAQSFFWFVISSLRLKSWRCLVLSHGKKVKIKRWNLNSSPSSPVYVAITSNFTDLTIGCWNLDSYRTWLLLEAQESRYELAQWNHAVYRRKHCARHKGSDSCPAGVCVVNTWPIDACMTEKSGQRRESGGTVSRQLMVSSFSGTLSLCRACTTFDHTYIHTFAPWPCARCCHCVVVVRVSLGFSVTQCCVAHKQFCKSCICDLYYTASPYWSCCPAARAKVGVPQHRGATKDGDHPQTPDHEKQLLWMEHAGYSLKS